jgi:hypothetical protein
MSLEPEGVNHFRSAFPNAVHLAGYGNTLFGVAMETADTEREAMDYFVLGNRVQLHVVQPLDSTQSWPPRLVKRGQTGAVLFHRLDESSLLVGVLERDEAVRIAPNEAAQALGGCADGVRNPHPPAASAARLQLGLY